MSRQIAIVGLVAAGVVGVGMVAGVGVLLFAVANGKRYPLELVQSLSDEQRAMAALIAESAHAAGLPAAIAGALIANAYAESRLDPDALGDRDARGIPHAVGLFQLNDARSSAMGYGMSIASRADPRTNIATFLRATQGPQGASVRQAAASGASLADLAALVSRDLERPANEAAEMVARRTYAIRLFGAPATARGSKLDYTG